MTEPWHAFEAPFHDGTTLHARFTTRHHGDFHVDADRAELRDRRFAVTEHPWLWLRQVHSANVVTVHDAAGVAANCGTEADASVTASAGLALAVTAADCAPVLLWVPSGAFAAVHAGWRGTVGGVLENAVVKLRTQGRAEDEPVRAVIGPCIHPDSYPFGPDLLDTVEGRLGPTVRSTTNAGEPALDLIAAVTSALAGADVDEIVTVGGDTADPDTYFSHRARGDLQRQTLVAWKT